MISELLGQDMGSMDLPMMFHVHLPLKLGKNMGLLYLRVDHIRS